MDEKQHCGTGMQAYRTVLGDAHIEHSLASLTPSNEGSQEMITCHAWDNTWTRPGLP